ncbi:uncharacterized protein LOC112513316 [Cynara cardunculus var. scolymus]|uniref:uncharacterized protein LOC112513316 n=1 Tax=Cynara cardunculus var. scolymus TaxID=59895 RepID=UPI000D62596F|nr:uncharacterized protein LOC112513316 [Cynara cardunculus var. scolymus]
MKRFKTPVTYADMSKGKGVAKEGTLQGRCFASGFDHEVLFFDDSSGSSSSLFGRQLQKTQVTPYLHKGLSFKEIIASPLPSLAFRDKATPPTCPYNRIKERLFGKGEPSSGATLFDAEHRQNVEVTRNSCKRKWEFEVPVKKVRERRGVGVKFDQERWLSMAPFWEQPPLAHFANPPSRIPASDVASSRVEFRSSLLDDVK